MSPQSMLNTPVELLRSAPPDSEQGSHGERHERRAAMSAVLGLFGLGVLFALASSLLH